MDAKFKGSIYGIIAAISYGTNPLGALSLYEAGINANSVLFYRFLLAAFFLGGLMFIQNKSFRVTRKELGILAGLGILFAASSLTLFLSFHYMDAGIASTILFVYPVIVTVIMAIFFKEKVSLITALSILLAIGGIGLLYKGNNGSVLNATGVLLVMLSSLSYALYIVAVNKSSLRMSSIKLTFLCAAILYISYHGSIIFWQQQPFTVTYNPFYVDVCYNACIGSYCYILSIYGNCSTPNRFNTYCHHGCIGTTHCCGYRYYYIQ